MSAKSFSGRAVWTSVAGLLTMALVLGTAGTPVAAGTGGHTVAQAVPRGRSWDSWAYDPAQREVVLFGGNGGPGPWPAPTRTFGATWTWAHGCWTEQQPASSPSSRQGAAMAWDPATRQLLLFGGGSDARHPVFFADTWVWTGTTWAQLHPATSPPPRHQAGLVYDAAMGEMILFGGRNDQGYLNDTWAWNGTAWTQLHPAAAPSGRDTFSLAYDPAAGSAILYGGFNFGGRLSDTWAWNGTTWAQLSPATSPGLDSPAWQAAYDTASHQLVLYGGAISDPLNYSAGMWAWTGTTWTPLHPALVPGARAYGAMTYDQADRRILLFGGNNETADPHDVLTWNGTTWKAPTCHH